MRIRLVVLLSVLGLCACDNQVRDWERARRDDTPTTYLEFLAKYPDSEYAGTARERMEALKEIGGWERAEFRNNEAGYAAFIEKYPDSERVADARDRIEDLERDEAWAVTQEADSAEVVAAFLRDYPESPQADEARALLADLERMAEPEVPTERPGDFRIQLAAFRTARAAEQELRRLVALFPDALLGPVTILSPDAEDTNPMFVLKSVPMNWQEAQAVCKKLTGLKQECLVVNR